MHEVDCEFQKQHCTILTGFKSKPYQLDQWEYINIFFKKVNVSYCKQCREENILWAMNQ